MKANWDDFLAEGMKSYKKASMIMGAFFNNIQSKLQDILKSRKEWGTFHPKETKAIRSTKYWADYPYINAQIHGTHNGEPTVVEIAVNWFYAETDYPFYWAYVYSPQEKYDKKILSYPKEGKIKRYTDRHGHGFLILMPNPEDFNLERDFNILLDEFVKTVF